MFHALFHRNPQPLWVFDPDTHAVLALNAAAEARYGYTAADLPGLRLADLVELPPGVPVGHCETDPTTDTPPIEVIQRTRDGGRFPARCGGYAVRFGGRAARLVVCTDLTAQRTAEAERDAGQQRLDLALEAAHLLSWDWDLVTGRSHYSADYFAFFGLPGGRPADGLAAAQEAVHPDDRGRLTAATERAVAGADTFEVDFRGPPLPPPAGQRFYRATGRVVRDAAGVPVRMVGVTQDVTDAVRAANELRQLEALRHAADKHASVALLAGGAAHDFNNLLTGILGHLALAREAAPGGPAAAHLDAIETAATRAAELCQQLLAYAGRGPAQPPGRVDLSAAAREMVALLRPVIGRQAEVTVDLADALPPVTADPTQLRQVLLNLLTNAAEAVGDGPGRVAVRTGWQAVDGAFLEVARLAVPVPPGEYVFAEVADTGCGIPADVLDRVFDPYFTTKPTGRGLGLATVLGVVRAHGGTVQVWSAEGAGTTFRVLLPAAAG